MVGLNLNQEDTSMDVTLKRLDEFLRQNLINYYLDMLVKGEDTDKALFYLSLLSK